MYVVFWLKTHDLFTDCTNKTGCILLVYTRVSTYAHYGSVNSWPQRCLETKEIRKLIDMLLKFHDQYHPYSISCGSNGHTLSSTLAISVLRPHAETRFL